jgi:hypothetical protein
MLLSDSILLGMFKFSSVRFFLIYFKVYLSEFNFGNFRLDLTFISYFLQRFSRTIFFHIFIFFSFKIQFILIFYMIGLCKIDYYLNKI